MGAWVSLRWWNRLAKVIQGHCPFEELRVFDQDTTIKYIGNIYLLIPTRLDVV